jgi:addiction module HigA family antidote
MSQKDLAEHIGQDVKVINRIVNGSSAVTAEVALKLAATFRTTPEFWLNAQMAVERGAMHGGRPVVPILRMTMGTEFCPWFSQPKMQQRWLRGGDSSDVHGASVDTCARARLDALLEWTHALAPMRAWRRGAIELTRIAARLLLRISSSA